VYSEGFICLDFVLLAKSHLISAKSVSVESTTILINTSVVKRISKENKIIVL